MMNEFTKEELEEIKRCLKYMINGGITPYSLLTMNTKKKVQDMIDNYCDHDWGNQCCGILDAPCVCNKCGRKL